MGTLPLNIAEIFSMDTFPSNVSENSWRQAGWIDTLSSNVFEISRKAAPLEDTLLSSVAEISQFLRFSRLPLNIAEVRLLAPD